MHLVALDGKSSLCKTLKLEKKYSQMYCSTSLGERGIYLIPLAF